VAELDSVGLVEVTSIAQGYLVEDAMLKAARVNLLLARTICSGKYLIVVAADVASVDAAVEAGVQAAAGTLIERRVLPHVHPSVFPAVAGSVDLGVEDGRALGVIETFSASSVIDVADAAAKAAAVTLLRIHLAMAIGGKGFVLLTGDLASVEAAVAAGSSVAADEGILVASGVIARPHGDLLREII
jgi:microcompartment protein CcmL/EutN